MLHQAYPTDPGRRCSLPLSSLLGGSQLGFSNLDYTRARHGLHGFQQRLPRWPPGSGRPMPPSDHHSAGRSAPDTSEFIRAPSPSSQLGFLLSFLVMLSRHRHHGQSRRSSSAGPGPPRGRHPCPGTGTPRRSVTPRSTRRYARSATARMDSPQLRMQLARPRRRRLGVALEGHPRPANAARASEKSQTRAHDEVGRCCAVQRANCTLGGVRETGEETKRAAPCG